MRMLTRCYPAWSSLATVAFVLGTVAGCRPVVWLPDSSGFVYTEDGDYRLVHYDVRTGKRHVLVAEMPARTPWPAVSPDRKHIAVARLIKDPRAKKSDAMQVILYDLEGKEVRRSAEFTWAPPRKADLAPQGSPEGGMFPRKGDKDDLHTGAFWAAGVGRLIVHDYQEVGRAGIYDLARDQLIVLEGLPPAFGGTPCRPDGKGFLLLRPNGDSLKLALVDWEGKLRPIRLNPEAIDSDEKRELITFPWIGTSAWEGNVAVVSNGTTRIRIDTHKLIGTFETVPTKEAFVGGKVVLQRFTFPKGGLKLQVLLGQEGPPEQPQGSFLRLELVGGMEGKPRLLKEIKNSRCVLLSPSPDGRWLAVRDSASGEILLVGSSGEVREIDSGSP